MVRLHNGKRPAVDCWPSICLPDRFTSCAAYPLHCTPCQPRQPEFIHISTRTMSPCQPYATVPVVIAPRLSLPAMPLTTRPNRSQPCRASLTASHHSSPALSTTRLASPSPASSFRALPPGKLTRAIPRRPNLTAPRQFRSLQYAPARSSPLLASLAYAALSNSFRTSAMRLWISTIGSFNASASAIPSARSKSASACTSSARRASRAKSFEVLSFATAM